MEQSVARLAHYQKVIGSNPIPAPILRGWSKGSSFGSLPKDNVRIVRSQPQGAECSVVKKHSAREDGLFSPSSTTTGINGDDMWLCDLKARYK